MNKGEI